MQVRIPPHPRRTLFPGRAQFKSKAILLTVAVAGGWMLATNPVHAGDTQPAGKSQYILSALNETSANQSKTRFDIDPQPMDSALSQFFEQSGVQIAYTSGDVESVRTPGVSGDHTPEEALKRLLKGSDLHYRFTGRNTVTVIKKAEGPDPESTGPSKNLVIAQSGDDKKNVLKKVVVSSTRTETPVSELTQSVSVVEKETIQEQIEIDRNLSSILGKTIPGMSPSTKALSTFGQTLRGRDFLVLIDGIPQSTPLRGASRDLNTINAEAIERIEVVRGGTPVYGFGATGGLVNIITRKPGEGLFNARSRFGIRMSSTHPSDSFSYETNHQVTGRKDQLDYLVNGKFVSNSGLFDADGDRLPPDPLGVQGGLADTDDANLLGKIGYDFNGGRQRAEFMVNYFRFLQDTDFTFGTGDPSNDVKTPAIPGNQNAKDPGTENLTLQMSFVDKDLLGSSLNAQFYYNDLTARFAKFPGFAQTEVASEKIGVRTTVDTPFDLREVPMTAIWGVDFLRDETIQNGIDGPTIVPLMKQNALAGFLELELPVQDWAMLRGGLRHESIWLDVNDVVNRNAIFVRGGNLTFNETLFNMGAVVFVDDGVEVFANFSQGFSLADIGRAIRDGTATSAEALQSEVQKVDNYELGVRGDFGRVKATVVGFYSESDNGTTFTPTLNIRKQPERIWGVEMAVDVQPSDLWTLGSSFTWMQGEIDLNDDGSFEEDLPTNRIPPIKVTAYANYNMFSWWKHRLQMVHSGNRDPNSTQFGGATVRDYTVVDLYSSARVGPGQLTLGIENLFNTDYVPLANQSGAQTYSFVEAQGQTVSLAYSLDW